MPAAFGITAYGTTAYGAIPGIPRTLSGPVEITTDVLAATRTAPLDVNAGVLAATRTAPLDVNAGVRRRRHAPTRVDALVRYSRDWRLRLYDADMGLLSQLDDVVSVSLRRQPNSAAQASYAVPYDAELIGDFQLAHNMAIYRGKAQKFAGRVTSRDLSGREAKLESIGHEDRLAALKTPRQWQGWNGRDLAAFARDVLYKFRFKRVTTQAEWEGAYTLSGVDTTTQPGEVWLAQEPYQSGLRFLSDGYVQLRMDLGPDALTTGRILRWAELAGDPTRITVQSRAAYVEADLDTVPWGEEMTAVNTGDDVQGNEVWGVPIADGGRWVDARVNLHTDDTISPDNEQNPAYYGRTPRLTGVEILWREPTAILPGDIPQTTGIFVEDGRWDRTNHLKAIRDECVKAEWHFRVRHDEAERQLVLDLAKRLGQDLSDTVVLRESESMAVTRLRDDDEEYANVLNIWGAGDGIDRLYLQLRNEAAITEWGEEVEGDFEVDTDDPEELATLGQEELDRRSTVTPRFAARVDAPNDWPEFGAGDTVKVVDPRSGYIADLEVTDEQWEYPSEEGSLSIGLGGASLDSPLEALIKGRRSRPREERPQKPRAPVNVVATGDRKAILLRWSGQADEWIIRHTTETATETVTWYTTQGKDEAFGIEETTEYDLDADASVFWSDWIGAPDRTREPINFRRLATVGSPEFDHRELELGSVHWYEIVAVVGDRTSDPARARGLAKDTTPPVPPVILGIDALIKGFKITLKDPLDPENTDIYAPDWDGFELHALEGGGSGFTPSDGTLVAKGKQIYFEVTGLSPGQQYAVKVTSYDTSGNKSEATF